MSWLTILRRGRALRTVGPLASDDFVLWPLQTPIVPLEAVAPSLAVEFGATIFGQPERCDWDLMWRFAQLMFVWTD